MMRTIFFSGSLILVLVISGHSLLAQNNPVNDNDEYTISKRFLSIDAEGAAKIAAASIIATFNGTENNSPYTGAGSCYIEFGKGEIGRVDVDFFSGPKPFGIHHDASAAMMADKEHFGASRKARWFDLK